MGEIFSAIFAMTGEKKSDEEISKKVENIFTKMDADGNGEISKDEFLDGAKEDKSIIEAFAIYEGLA